MRVLHIQNGYESKSKSKSSVDFHSFVNLCRQFGKSGPTIVVAVYGSWILIGMLWYRFYQPWTFATAFYYAMEAGLSIGFCWPSEKDDISRAFTIVFVLAGSSIVSGALGYFASYIFSSKTIRIANPVIYEIDSMSLRNRSGNVTFLSLCRYLWYVIKYLAGWYSGRIQVKAVTALLLWFGVGIVFCMLYERWDFILSLYFVVTSLSTGGLYTPFCFSSFGEGGIQCNMGDVQGSMLGIFFLIGVPLYTFTTSHFSTYGMQYAMQRHRLNRMYEPITVEEFLFAANLLSDEGSTTLELGEFILLELLRMRATTPEEIEKLKLKFQHLDIRKKGRLTRDDFDELKERRLVVSRKRTSIELHASKTFKYQESYEAYRELFSSRHHRDSEAEELVYEDTRSRIATLSFQEVQNLGFTGGFVLDDLLSPQEVSSVAGYELDFKGIDRDDGSDDSVDVEDEEKEGEKKTSRREGRAAKGSDDKEAQQLPFDNRRRVADRLMAPSLTERADEENQFVDEFDDFYFDHEEVLESSSTAFGHRDNAHISLADEVEDGDNGNDEEGDDSQLRETWKTFNSKFG